jgi:tetratricopeptide (TPR) repeat protein
MGERALEVRRKLHGPNHPFIAVVLNNLSLVATDRGDTAEARRLVNEAIAMIETKPGNEHFLGAFLINLADSYKRAGEFAEADPQYRRAIEVLEKSSGGSVWLAEALTGLASVFASQGKLVGAEKLLTRAMQVRDKTTGTNTPAYAAAQRDLAALYRAQKRTTEADKLEKSLSFR